jgi:outer membrane protein assembly factor BamB
LTKSSPSAPTIAYGTVFVQTASEMLYAVDASTGQQDWSAICGCDVGGAPAVAANRVFTANGTADSVEAFDARTGASLWAVPLEGPADGSPAAVDGKVFVGAGLGFVYALDQATGAVVWQVNTGGGHLVASTPAVANGLLYAGDEGGDLYAFREFDGKRLWRAHTQYAFVYSAPIVANGVVYAATKDAYAFDAVTGESLWHATTDYVNAAPAVADGVLYVDDFSGRLWAFGLRSVGP